jgi:CRISPR-associated protein Cst1
MAQSGSEFMTHPAGLLWTGQPVIDMGAVAIALISGAEEPAAVTRQQWKAALSSLAQDYIDGLYRKPSMILLTNNAFENPVFSKDPERRARQIRAAFDKARGEVPASHERCAFFPEQPAVIRAARDQMPLLQGKAQFNFYPHGHAELPLSALALGCILALPVVSPVVSGRFMVVAADDNQLLMRLCERWYMELQRERALLRIDGTVTERKAPRTRLFDALDQVFNKPDGVRRSQDSAGNFGITLYHLSNSGNGPIVDIYTVPPHVNGFLHRARGAKWAPAWNALVRVFWRNTKGALSGEEPNSGDRSTLRNDLYESLPGLPQEARNFVPRFFGRYILNRAGVSTNLKVADLDQWPILELFLREVMHMHPDRIQKIRELADEIAREIKNNDDRQLYRKIMGRASGYQGYTQLRQMIIRATEERLRREKRLLLSLDDYLLVFEEGAEFPRADWMLARDLIRLRCLETLYNEGYDFGRAPELEETGEPEEDEELTESVA